MQKSFILIFLLISVLLAGGSFFALAQESVKINYFYLPGCHNCAEAKEHLDFLQTKYPDLKINKFNISENHDLVAEFYQKYNVPNYEQGLVPIIFTQDSYFLGADSIKNNLENCIEKCVSGQDKKLLIDENKYSLPVLAVVLGFLDGFNICSLGALIFILSLVLSLKSRKKTLIFGGLFILTTSVIYGILIGLWYKAFALVANYLRSLEVLIGLVGIGGAVYFLKEFIRMKTQGATCKIGTSQKIMAKFSDKLKSLFQGKSVILIILAILLFSGIITIVEFPCSAVVPVAFAGILAKANLETGIYILYIAIFIFFYMLDEIIIFTVAFITTKIWFAQNKSATIWITLAQAIILFALGVYYLFL